MRSEGSKSGQHLPLSVNFDWRNGTSCLEVAILPVDSRLAVSIYGEIMGTSGHAARPRPYALILLPMT